LKIRTQNTNIESPDFWVNLWNQKLGNGENNLMTGYKSRELWDYMAENYNKWSGDEDNPEVDKILARLGELNVPLGKIRVLEIGCGTGRVSIPLAEAGAEVVASDFSPRMLEILRESIPRGLKGSVETVEADWNKVDLVSQKWEKNFDLVIAFMTPAIITPESFLKLSRASRHMCCFRGWARRKPDPLIAKLWSAILDGQMPDPVCNAILALNLLCAAGKNPKAEFQEVCWQRSQEIGEARECCLRFFSNIPGRSGKNPETEITEYLGTAAKNGQVERRVAGTTCSMFWEEFERSCA